MRLILTLVTILFFILKTFAGVNHNNIIEVHINKLDNPVLLLDHTEILADIEIKTAILYKMKENIIRRELSFTPKKKWMKWV